MKKEQIDFFTSCEKDNILFEMSDLLRAGFSKCNIVTGEGSATEQWLLNMGVSPDSDPGFVIGKWDMVEPQDREHLLSVFDLMRSGLQDTMKRDIRVKNGDSWKCILFRMQVTDFSPETGVIMTVSSAYDVSNSRDLRCYMPESQKENELLSLQHEVVLESLSSALIYIDTDYVVRWSTLQSIKTFGSVQIGLKYRVGEKCYNSVFGRSEPCEKCSFQEMLLSRKRTAGLFDDESGAAIEIRANPVFNKQKQLLGGLLQLEDATSRVYQQRKITELNRTMEAILGHIPVCVFVKNPNEEFRYIYWNKAMADYTKVPVEKVLGRTDWEVFPRAEDADKFRKDDIYLLETRQNIEFQEEYVDAEGNRRVVNTLKTLIPVEEKLPWLLGVTWDITDLKNTEAELIKAKEKAEESDKFKSMFLANMSHEIRTPLHAIVGFSELLIDETLEQDEKQEYMSIVKTNTNLLLQLVSDILDLSRIEAQDLEYTYRNVSINALCSRIAMTSSLQAKCSVPIVFDPGLPDYIIHCDENRVQQIITNFVNNAVKFTHVGSITISYKLISDTEIEIAVVDTGIGIPAEKVSAVFDRFIKLNSFVQGTGLGLSICKNLVEHMNGRIGVESKEGKGSMFWFTLPYDKNIASETI